MPRPSNILTLGIVSIPALVLLAGLGVQWFQVAQRHAASELAVSAGPDAESQPRIFPVGQPEPTAVLWWEGIPDTARQQMRETGTGSNIHRDDYAGPESCRRCHQKNYDAWSEHPHRRMNALAGESNVVGDFSEEAAVAYNGGRANFFKEADQYRMELNRDGTRRVFAIHQTIGSRFFQYYIGQLIEGPEPQSHHSYEIDHVLPFGFWIDRGEWVPIVHVHDDVPDDKLFDPFDPPMTLRDPSLPGERGKNVFVPYAAACNGCHTTFPLGDAICRSPQLKTMFTPALLHLQLHGYLHDAHPEILEPRRHPAEYSDEEQAEVYQSLVDLDAREHAVTLGISCEACHLGSKEHAEGRTARPAFFPSSPDLLVESVQEIDVGRNHDNVNWICGRCHTGPRPTFAAGMGTWNSTEFTDASLGSCYSQLTCIHCHNPHRGIGPKWTLTGAQDDALCIRCHQEYEPSEARTAHTHHPADSEGARCMNCHMPRVNEGLQDVVRTHMIFSPTHKDMFEQNHPNACNLCHTDQPVDWTLTYLKDWYGATFSKTRISKNYPKREQPVALGWLASDEKAVRLVGADALTRTRSEWALPQLIETLDDAYIGNRQFAMIGFEKMFSIQLTAFGYRFYLTPRERRGPLDAVRRELLPAE